jgi:hypothetical protein
MSQQHAVTCEHCAYMTGMRQDPINPCAYGLPSGWVTEGFAEFCSRDCRAAYRARFGTYTAKRPEWIWVDGGGMKA